jgi:hypothetical protein
MRFAFKTSPQETTWAELLAVWKAADDIDVFESGWTFDHFYPIFGNSTGPCLEGWTTLTALAQATTRLRLGTLVTGIHYRHPAVLANMVAALDVISDGRLELGIGAGWNEEESGAYGIELGSIKERMDRFEEACQVLISLLSQQTTTSSKMPATSPRARSARTPRSASEATAKNARCVSPPNMPSTGTLSAAHPRSSPVSAPCSANTAPTSGVIRKRSCCRRTCAWHKIATTRRSSRTRPSWQPGASIWASYTSRHRTTRLSWRRWPRRSEIPD